MIAAVVGGIDGENDDNNEIGSSGGHRHHCRGPDVRISIVTV